jgi:hypothetical protein
MQATLDVLTLFIWERDNLNRAIEALGGQAKRGGHPPGIKRAAVLAKPKGHNVVAVRRRALGARTKA